MKAGTSAVAVLALRVMTVRANASVQHRMPRPAPSRWRRERVRWAGIPRRQPRPSAAISTASNAEQRCRVQARRAAEPDLRRGVSRPPSVWGGPSATPTPPRPSSRTRTAMASRWLPAARWPRPPATLTRRGQGRCSRAGVLWARAAVRAGATTPGQAELRAGRHEAGAGHCWARPRLPGCYGVITMAPGS